MAALPWAEPDHGPPSVSFPAERISREGSFRDGGKRKRKEGVRMLTLNSDVIYTIINIVILCALLRILLWKPVLGIIEKRQQTIRDDLDEADRKNREAEAVKAQYEASLTGARKESADLVEQARAEAGERYDAIIAQANAEAEAIREKAGADAAAEKEKMLAEAKGELADLAILAAAKLMGGTVDEETDRRILDDWLAENGGLS